MAKSLYYALTIGAEGASTAAYYSLTPTSDLEISQGGVSIEPTSASPTMVSIYPQTLQIQAPAGSMSGGVTVITDASNIAGRVMVSPPVDVAVVTRLYGAGGQELGTSIIDPGVGSGTFDFPVSSSDAIAPSDASAVLGQLLPQPA